MGIRNKFGAIGLGSGPRAGNNHINLDPGADGIAGDQPETVTLQANIP
jgi:hypothetical protein